MASPGKNAAAWTLDQSLGFSLNKVGRAMRRALDTKLIQHNITVTQYIVLTRLWEEEGISLSVLGERMHMDNPTLTGIIDRMERDEILQRRRDGEDRRMVKVFLLDRGKKLHEEIGTLAEQTDAGAWDGFSPAEKRQLVRMLNRIWNNIHGEATD